MSNEKRLTIINMFSLGNQPKYISENLEIPVSTIYKIISHFKIYGKISSLEKGGPKNVKIDNNISAFIKKKVDQECDISLSCLKKIIMNTFNKEISCSALHNHLKGFNYTLKKIQLMPQRRISNDIASLKKEYAQSFLNILSQISEHKIFFVDEVGFCVSMRNNYGRSLKGSTPTLTVPSLRTRNISICCMMNKFGVKYYKVSHRAYNGDSFCGYIKDVFDHLKSLNIENIIVICDNASIHKSQLLKKEFEENGNQLKFLPPYSPMLNPIENMFSKKKKVPTATLR